MASISRSNASLWQLHLFVSTTAPCECAFSALPVLGLLTSVIQPLLSLQVESRVLETQEEREDRGGKALLGLSAVGLQCMLEEA